MGRLGMRPVLIATLAVCVTAVVAIALLPLTVPALHGGRPRRGSRDPARAAGGAHDLPEDGELPPAHPALLARRVGAGDHLGRRAGRHHVRRHPVRHGLGHPARRRAHGHRRHLVHLLARARPRAHPAFEAAVRHGARAARRCCSRPSSASCSSARAPRSRRASSPPSGMAAPRPASCSRSSRSAASPAASFLGHVPIGPWSTARRMLIVFVGTSLAAFSMDFWWLAVTLFIAGIGIAPALAVLFAHRRRRASSSRTPPRPTAGSAPASSSARRSAPRSRASSSTRNGPPGAFWAATGLAFLGVLVPTVVPSLASRPARP